MISTRVLAKMFPDADFVLNGDAGNGTLEVRIRPWPTISGVGRPMPISTSR
jgi:hypothetical protein